MFEKVVRQFALERVRIVSGESKFGSTISGTTKSSLILIFKKWCKGKKCIGAKQMTKNGTKNWPGV